MTRFRNVADSPSTNMDQRTNDTAGYNYWACSDVFSQAQSHSSWEGLIKPGWTSMPGGGGYLGDSSG